MLVLTRKQNEDIVINGNIIIKILDAHNGRARVGITAPKEVSIHRSEIQEKVEKEGQVRARP